MRKLIARVGSLLSSRVARNIYLWVVLLLVVLDMNYNNERAYHYGIIQTNWYPWIIAIGTLLQMALVYVNNLVLAPRLLSKKKIGKYILFAFLLVLIVSLAYTVGLKTAKHYVNVNQLQQIGMVSAPVSAKWTFDATVDDMMTYLIGNSMWVFIFTMAWYMNDYYKQQKILAASEKKRIEAELHFLKSQLNPHFLFNTLNNMYGLAMKKADSTPDVILKLSSILRYILYESNAEIVSFDKEKEIAQAYIDLELIRLQNKGNLQFFIHTDGPYNTPPLLWLPVLENIFKHGTRYIADSYFIDFKYVIENSIVTISGSNSYKEMNSSEAEKKAGGIGLANLEKRLKLLYPEKHKIIVEKTHDMFNIEVKIELS